MGLPVSCTCVCLQRFVPVLLRSSCRTQRLSFDVVPIHVIPSREELRMAALTTPLAPPPPASAFHDASPPPVLLASWPCWAAHAFQSQTDCLCLCTQDSGHCLSGLDGGCRGQLCFESSGAVGALQSLSNRRSHDVRAYPESCNLGHFDWPMFSAGIQISYEAVIGPWKILKPKLPAQAADLQELCEVAVTLALPEQKLVGLAANSASIRKP